MLKSFEIGDIDFFISSDPYWDKNFYRRFIFSEPSVLIVPNDFQIPLPLTWESLRFCGLPSVANSLASTNGQFERAYFSSLGSQYVDRITVNGTITFLEYIKNKLGWGIQTPLFIAMYPDFLPSIKTLPMPEPIECRDLYLLSRMEPSFVAMADEITEIVKQTLIKKITPELLHIAPWIGPYLNYPGAKGLERLRYEDAYRSL